MTVAASRWRAPPVPERPVQWLRADPAYPPDRTPNMPESFAHERTCHYALYALRRLARQRPRELLLGGNTDLYLREGDPQPVFAPDVLIAYDVALEAQASYRFWEAGKPPDLVMEVASVSTVARDNSSKRTAYAQAGIPEYWQCDPAQGDLLQPPLQGWRLQGRRYVPIAAEAGPDADRYYSEVLQTWWGWLRPAALPARGREQLRLRLWDPRRAVWYPLIADSDALQEQVEEQAVVEAAARRQAEEQAAVEAAARRQAEEQAAVEAAARRQAEDRHRRLWAAAREAGLDLSALGLDPEESP